MSKVIDFLIHLKQLEQPKTIEQMKRLNSGLYCDVIQECIDKKDIIVAGKTALGIETYWLSDFAQKAVEKEIKNRNDK